MKQSLIAQRLITAFVIAALSFVLSGCVKEASTDEDILNDAGTASNAAIVLDPDEVESSSSAQS
ncbi:MAG: hypothetical protein IJ113_05725 [Eggerthellaceae bacterium]|nr:hypothetical protein [Eggerthellaceae bacterium]